jgi:hypothetical protein
LPAVRLSAAAAPATLSVVIHDVDEALRALVKRDALNGSKVDIAFDAPTKEWVAKRNAPTVDMYLYDIREDVTRRETAWVEVRDEKGIVKERRLPPRRFRLSYLVTAWTNRPEDEHRLLSAMLSCFVRHEYVPPELLVGELEGQALPVLMNISLPVPADRNIADVWSAMGGELKPSLDLIVTAPLDIDRSLAAGPPVQEVPFLELTKEEPGTIKGGKSAKGGNGASPRMRSLPTSEADFTPTADVAGRGGAASTGAATGAGATGKGGAAKGGAAAKGAGSTEEAAGARGVPRGAGQAGADEGLSPLPDETFYGSAPGQPGRRIRVRAVRPRRPQ